MLMRGYMQIYRLHDTLSITSINIILFACGAILNTGLALVQEFGTITDTYHPNKSNSLSVILLLAEAGRDIAALSIISCEYAPMGYMIQWREKLTLPDRLRRCLRRSSGGVGIGYLTPRVCFDILGVFHSRLCWMPCSAYWVVELFLLASSYCGV